MSTKVTWEIVGAVALIAAGYYGYRRYLRKLPTDQVTSISPLVTPSGGSGSTLSFDSGPSVSTQVTVPAANSFLGRQRSQIDLLLSGIPALQG